MRRIQGLDEFSSDLDAFVGEHNLPQEWFTEPDHLAIKCRDELHYEDTVRVFQRTEMGEIDQAVLNNRKIATIQLAGGVTVGRFGDVQWLEVMEPRPEKVGKDTVGIDHIEFFVTDLQVVGRGLDKLGVPWQPESNQNHSWLTVVLNERNQELKFTSKRLEEIAREGREKGQSHPR